MKKNVILFLIGVFVLTSCQTDNTDNSAEITQQITPKYVQTLTLEEKVFGEQIKLPGKISAFKETAISSLSSGIIKTINVNVGDQVKAGDILATIDTNSNLANIQLDNANISYNNAVSVYNSTKATLEKTLETAKLQYDNAKIARDNTYSSTEKQLELAKTQLDNADTSGSKENTSNTSLELAQKSLENAKLSLENFLKNSEENLKTLNTKKDSILSTLKVTIEGTLIALDGSLRSVDELLGITDLNAKLNDDYEIYLSAKNSAYKKEAEDLFTKNNRKYEELKSAFQTKDFLSRTEPELVAYYNELFTLVSDNLTLLDRVVLVLNNTISSAKFTDSDINSIKSKMVSLQTQFATLKGNLTTLYSSYNDIVDSISSTITSLTTQKSSLEQAVKLAEATYNNTKANISSAESTTKIQYDQAVESVKSARETSDNALKIAENQYNSAKANYDSQLIQLKAQIDGSSGQKNSVAQQMANSQIKAPYDGVIISKNVEIGSMISQGMTAFSIANSTEKIVKLDVSAENVKYLNVGKEVKLEKNGLTATGTIFLVGAGMQNSSMYPVEIKISENKDLGNFEDSASSAEGQTPPFIPPHGGREVLGDFANSVILGDFIDIYIDKNIGTDKYLIVPFSAIIAGDSGDYHVFVVGEDNIAKEQKVSLGASNSMEVIVSSGLKNGDRVIVNGTLNVRDGDVVEER